jgi:hypothetical protein
MIDLRHSAPENLVSKAHQEVHVKVEPQVANSSRKQPGEALIMIQGSRLW